MTRRGSRPTGLIVFAVVMCVVWLGLVAAAVAVDRDGSSRTPQSCVDAIDGYRAAFTAVGASAGLPTVNKPPTDVGALVTKLQADEADCRSHR